MLPLVQTAGHFAKRIMILQRASSILPDDVLNGMLKSLFNGRLQNSDAKQTLRPTIDKPAWEASSAEEQDAFIDALVKDTNIKKQLTALLKLSYKSVKDDIVTSAVFEFFPGIENSDYLNECRALLTKCNYGELTVKARVRPPITLIGLSRSPPYHTAAFAPPPLQFAPLKNVNTIQAANKVKGKGDDSIGPMTLASCEFVSQYYFPLHRADFYLNGQFLGMVWSFTSASACLGLPLITHDYP